MVYFHCLYLLLHLLIHSSLIPRMFTHWSKDQALHDSADILSDRKERSGSFIPVCQIDR